MYDNILFSQKNFLLNLHNWVLIISTHILWNSPSVIWWLYSNSFKYPLIGWLTVIKSDDFSEIHIAFVTSKSRIVFFFFYQKKKKISRVFFFFLDILFNTYFIEYTSITEFMYFCLVGVRGVNKCSLNSKRVRPWRFVLQASSIYILCATCEAKYFNIVH